VLAGTNLEFLWIYNQTYIRQRSFSLTLDWTYKIAPSILDKNVGVKKKVRKKLGMLATELPYKTI
jgi:hypothetical protein